MPNVKTRKSRTKLSFWKMIKWEKDKTLNNVVSHNSKRQKNMNWSSSSCKNGENGCFRERMTFFSLEFREIRSSEFVGIRSKAALRGEAYAWTPVLGSFVKLREVGDLSYLGFTLYLSVL